MGWGRTSSSDRKPSSYPTTSAARQGSSARSGGLEGWSPTTPRGSAVPPTPHPQGLPCPHRHLPGGHLSPPAPPGLPKAAVITELKLMLVANLGRVCGLRPDDVVYTALPLYHSAGLMVGLGGCLEVGR